MIVSPQEWIGWKDSRNLSLLCYLVRMNEEVGCTFAMLLWSIWWRRNDFLWEDKLLGESQVVHRAKENLLAGVKPRKAKYPDRSSKQSIPRNKCERWPKPRIDFVKCLLWYWTLRER